MLSIGLSEVILIFLLALLVFGPDKVPQFVQTVGQCINNLRDMSRSLKRDFDQEIAIVKDPLNIKRDE